MTIIIVDLLPAEIGTHPLSGLADMPGAAGDVMTSGSCPLGPLAVGQRQYVKAARASQVNGGAGPIRVLSVKGDAEWRQRYDVNVPGRPASWNVSL